MGGPAKSLHEARFPNESADYRHARDALLEAEIALRRQIEAVAALRRALPPGGAVREDYEFVEGEDSRRVRLSALFGEKPTLLVYNFMYGPKMAQACPSCTSILDSLDGAAVPFGQMASLAVVAKSPIQRIRDFAKERGWRRLRLLSSADNSYNSDYHGEDAKGAQMPMLNVFKRREDEILHTYSTELRFVPSDPGQDPRHVDSIWPLWSLLDFTPDGRGDFHPKLRYD